MSKKIFNYSITKADEVKYGKEYTFTTISKTELDSFNSDILGLGNLDLDGEYFQVLSAILDLQGFTDFCNQVDSHIVIPEFIDKFLNWLFQKIKDISIAEQKDTSVQLWQPLPFYAKFLGDGVLLLWDTAPLKGDIGALFNIVRLLINLTKFYTIDFYPELKKQFSKPPSILRCGVARGQVISIGNGEDYIGSCINISARLQKISSLSFAVSRRGFDLKKTSNQSLNKELLSKKIKIRGIGEDELVYILKEEYDKLNAIEKSIFIDE